MNHFLKLLIVAGLGWAGYTHADETLRCNSAVVSVNASVDEVLRKCGEPAGRAPAGYVKSTDGAGRVANTPVESWTYGPSSGMYHYLRFEGGRLVSIRSERG